MRTLIAKLLIAICVTLAIPSFGLTQPAGPWPIRPIRLIVPTAAGGPTDFVARVVAPELSSALGQQVWLDNRAGGGHLIGTAAAATSEADGYTFLIVTTPFVVNPALIKKMPYEQKDFQPVSWLASMPLVMVVPSSLPVKSVADLIALAKEKPGKIDYGSAGNATGPHLAGALFTSMAGIQLQHVPYRGGPQSQTAIIRGEASVLFDTPANALPHVANGALRALAVTTAKRIELAPDVPTLAETGLAGFEFDSWMGIVAPSGVPQDIVKRVETELMKVMARAEVRKRFLEAGFVPVVASAEQLAQQINKDLAKWDRVVKDSGMTAE